MYRNGWMTLIIQVINMNMGQRGLMAVMLVVGAIFAGLMFSHANANDLEGPYADKGNMATGKVYDIWNMIVPEDQDNANAVGQWCSYETTVLTELYEVETLGVTPNGELVIFQGLDERLVSMKATYEWCYGNNNKDAPQGNFKELLKSGVPVQPYFDDETDISNHFVTPVPENGTLKANCIADVHVRTGFLYKEYEGEMSLLEDILYLKVINRQCSEALVEEELEEPLEEI